MTKAQKLKLAGALNDLVVDLLRGYSTRGVVIFTYAEWQSVLRRQETLRMTIANMSVTEGAGGESE